MLRCPLDNHCVQKFGLQKCTTGCVAGSSCVADKFADSGWGCCMIGEGPPELGAGGESQLLELARQVFQAAPEIIPDLLPALLARRFGPTNKAAHAALVAEVGARGATGGGGAYWRYKAAQAAMTHGAHALLHPWVGRIAEQGSVEDDRVWFWLLTLEHICTSEVALQRSICAGVGPGLDEGSPGRHLLSAAKCLGAACDARTGFGFQRRWVAVRAMEQDAVRAAQALLGWMDRGGDPSRAPGAGFAAWMAVRDFRSAAESWEHLLKGSFGVSWHSEQCIRLAVARCRFMSYAMGTALERYRFAPEGGGQASLRTTSLQEVLQSLSTFAEGLHRRPSNLAAGRAFQRECLAALEQHCGSTKADAMDVEISAAAAAAIAGSGGGDERSSVASDLLTCLQVAYASDSSPLPAHFFCMRPAVCLALDRAAAGPVLDFRRGCGLGALTFAVSGTLANLPPCGRAGGRSTPRELLLAADLVNTQDPDLAWVGTDHPMPGAHLPPRGGAQGGSPRGGSQRAPLLGLECGFSGECTTVASELPPGAYVLVVVATLECEDGSLWDLPVGRVPGLTVNVS